MPPLAHLRVMVMGGEKKKKRERERKGPGRVCGKFAIKEKRMGFARARVRKQRLLTARGEEAEAGGRSLSASD